MEDIKDKILRANYSPTRYPDKKSEENANFYFMTSCHAYKEKNEVELLQLLLQEFVSKSEDARRLTLVKSTVYRL